MLEVLALFRARGFRTAIVSGGTTEFMRPWAEQVYGVPAEQVVGTTFKLRYEVQGRRGDLLTLPEIELIDDGPGKPAGISRILGRRPVAAFGNSDGDYEMLEYTTTGPGPGSASSSTTTTASANTPTTGSRISAASTVPWRRQGGRAGSSPRCATIGRKSSRLADHCRGATPGAV